MLWCSSKQCGRLAFWKGSELFLRKYAFVLFFHFANKFGKINSGSWNKTIGFDLYFFLIYFYLSLCLFSISKVWKCWGFLFPLFCFATKCGDLGSMWLLVMLYKSVFPIIFICKEEMVFLFLFLFFGNYIFF